MGIEHDAEAPGVDDGQLLPTGGSPEEWVAALAYLKAMAALETGRVRAPVVLGADTVVVKSRAGVRRIIGQPRDRDDARAILKDLREGEHDVLTGVALINTASGRRDLFVDRARVCVGLVSDQVIERYLDTELWRGKAGAYNLSERLQDGWPIEYHGDPGTIMGLPTAALLARLAGISGSTQTLNV